MHIRAEHFRRQYGRKTIYLLTIFLDRMLESASPGVGCVCSRGVSVSGVSAPEGVSSRGVSALGGRVSAPGGSALEGGLSARGDCSGGGVSAPGGYPSMH